MKLRNLLMTAVFLLAVSASFASRVKGTGVEAFRLVTGGCIGGITVQDNCSISGNGPNCTIWAGGNYYDIAYYFGPEYIPCMARLRQP